MSNGHSLLCATRKGLFRFDTKSGEFMFQPGLVGQQAPDLWVTDLVRDQSGALWILTGSGFLRRAPDGTVEKFGIKDGLPSLTLRCVASDVEGRIWIGTAKGLCRLAAQRETGGKIVDRVYTTRDGLGSDWINDLLLRHDGTLCVGTGRSVSSLVRKQNPLNPSFSGYGIDTGLPSLASLGEDRAGNSWLGTYRGATGSR
jgi:ligand-binding sensor domain-containing protein